jgi:hypothetical protein
MKEATNAVAKGIIQPVNIIELREGLDYMVIE